MENDNYRIELADGTVLDDLKLNGNNYVSKEEVTADIFEDNLSIVKITHGKQTEAYEDMELIDIQKHGDEWWVLLGEKPEEDLNYLKLRSDVDYIAAMADIDLEG